ncbi:hypothetical protein IQ254_15475 [Nodosilinea sp. LEGE 07088]|uniref:hypothetical protein n=1 Tax=Nodosilinea sp. LEGE 07088 TaxID=2777968 RepID=UPI00187E1ADA|nr:hypothetical protein [Nodosilinea sp. LEGE 07088]MBE9138573.1 hypothetical protein [Nodosilinea sp. LEGE 07088]
MGSATGFNVLVLASIWWLNRLGLGLAIAILWFVVLRCLHYALALMPDAEPF